MTEVDILRTERDALREALLRTATALRAVLVAAPGYDWNADPRSLTLITGDVLGLADSLLSEVEPL